MFRYKLFVQHTFLAPRPFRIDRDCRFAAYNAVMRREFNEVALAEAPALNGVIEITLHLTLPEEVTAIRIRQELNAYLRDLSTQLDKSETDVGVVIRQAEAGELRHNMTTTVTPQS